MIINHHMTPFTVNFVAVTLDAEYTDYVSRLKSGLKSGLKRTSHRQIKTIKAIPYWDWVLSIPATNKEAGTNEFLQRRLRWCNKKDVVPTLEAIQKKIAFYHDKEIYILKLGCTLPNLANICFHKSTDAKFYPITESDKDFLEKIREDVVGGPSIAFTRRAVVDKTFIRKSTNLCKSIDRIDASQQYTYSMCQTMPTGLYTHWDLDSELSKLIPRQNKTRSFENMVMSYFQRTRPECEIESFFTTGRQKKIDCFSVDGFCSHCNTVFEAMGCLYFFCPCQELLPYLTEQNIHGGSKKWELDALRRHYIQEKGFKVIEMWECEW